PGAELLTRDPRGNTIDKTLTLDAYVCWRIAEKPGSVDRFIRTVGTLDGARALLGQRINSELGAAVGQMELDDLVSTDPGKVDQRREGVGRRAVGEGGQPRGEAGRRRRGVEVVWRRLVRRGDPAAGSVSGVSAPYCL